jgi:hypothetical protein
LAPAASAALWKAATAARLGASKLTVPPLAGQAGFPSAGVSTMNSSVDWRAPVAQILQALQPERREHAVVECAGFGEIVRANRDMRKSCHHILPSVNPSTCRERCARRGLAAKTVAALPGSGKPPTGCRLGVAFRAQIEQVPAMNLVALKRKTMKTPPRRALEVSAR